jgi:hypothetical protein
MGMAKVLLAICLGMFGVMAAAPAGHAQTTDQAKSRSRARAQESIRTVTPRPVFIPFTDDEVFGDRAVPDGVTVETRGAASFGRLHAVRKHFVPEMLKAAENQ